MKTKELTTKDSKVEKKVRKPILTPVVKGIVRFIVLIALGTLAYAGVLSLIKADVIVGNVIAAIIVALLIKEIL